MKLARVFAFVVVTAGFATLMIGCTFFPDFLNIKETEIRPTDFIPQFSTLMDDEGMAPADCEAGIQQQDAVDKALDAVANLYAAQQLQGLLSSKGLTLNVNESVGCMLDEDPESSVPVASSVPMPQQVGSASDSDSTLIEIPAGQNASLYLLEIAGQQEAWVTIKEDNEAGRKLMHAETVFPDHVDWAIVDDSEGSVEEVGWFVPNAEYTRYFVERLRQQAAEADPTWMAQSPRHHDFVMQANTSALDWNHAKVVINEADQWLMMVVPKHGSLIGNHFYDDGESLVLQVPIEIALPAQTQSGVVLVDQWSDAWDWQLPESVQVQAAGQSSLFNESFDFCPYQFYGEISTFESVHCDIWEANQETKIQKIQSNITKETIVATSQLGELSGINQQIFGFAGKDAKTILVSQKDLSVSSIEDWYQASLNLNDNAELSTPIPANANSYRLASEDFKPEGVPLLFAWGAATGACAILENVDTFFGLTGIEDDLSDFVERFSEVAEETVEKIGWACLVVSVINEIFFNEQEQSPDAWDFLTTQLLGIASESFERTDNSDFSSLSYQEIIISILNCNDTPVAISEPNCDSNPHDFEMDKIKEILITIQCLSEAAGMVEPVNLNEGRCQAAATDEDPDNYDLTHSTEVLSGSMAAMHDIGTVHLSNSGQNMLSNLIQVYGPSMIFTTYYTHKMMQLTSENSFFDGFSTGNDLVFRDLTNLANFFDSMTNTSDIADFELEDLANTSYSKNLGKISTYLTASIIEIFETAEDGGTNTSDITLTEAQTESLLRGNFLYHMVQTIVEEGPSHSFLPNVPGPRAFNVFQEITPIDQLSGQKEYVDFYLGIGCDCHVPRTSTHIFGDVEPNMTASDVERMLDKIKRVDEILSTKEAVGNLQEGEVVHLPRSRISNNFYTIVIDQYDPGELKRLCDELGDLTIATNVVIIVHNGENDNFVACSKIHDEHGDKEEKDEKAKSICQIIPGIDICDVSQSFNPENDDVEETIPPEQDNVGNGGGSKKVAYAVDVIDPETKEKLEEACSGGNFCFDPGI